MTARRVLLWRHGRTAHNHSGIWQGQLDVELDEVGWAQAEVAAGAIQGSLVPGEPLAVVSSDLIRARDTGMVLAKRCGVDVVQDERLREIYAGRWQGLTRAQIVAAGMGDELDAWMHGDDVPVGGGERRSEVGRRGAAAVAEHAAAMDGGVLVVAGHGGVLRGSILTLLGMEPGRWRLLGGLGNGNWAELVPDEPTWRLTAYNVAVPGEVASFVR